MEQLTFSEEPIEITHTRYLFPKHHLILVPYVGEQLSISAKAIGEDEIQILALKKNSYLMYVASTNAEITSHFHKELDLQTKTPQQKQPNQLFYTTLIADPNPYPQIGTLDNLLKSEQFPSYVHYAITPETHNLVQILHHITRLAKPFEENYKTQQEAFTKLFRQQPHSTDYEKFTTAALYQLMQDSIDVEKYEHSATIRNTLANRPKNNPNEPLSLSSLLQLHIASTPQSCWETAPIKFNSPTNPQF
jgi:hypothetical protein